MGNQTTIIIRNDAIGDIRANPEEFVRHLLASIERVAAGLEPNGTDFGCGNHANPARVIECHHADSTTVVACGGSTAQVLTIIHNKWRWDTPAQLQHEVWTTLALEEKKAKGVR